MHDAVAMGALLPAAFGVFVLGIRGLIWLFEKEPQTVEEKRVVVHRRLEEKYRRAGMPNPSKAADNHLSMMRHAAIFKADACREYVATGKPLSEIREQWWKDRARSIREVREIAESKAEAAQYCAFLKQEIDAEDEDEIFTTPEASQKWAAEKIQRDAEMKAWRARMERQRDPVGDDLIEKLYAAGDRI
jgi:hypothetical protein